MEGQRRFYRLRVLNVVMAALLLVVGVCANVGVAWAIAAMFEPDGGQKEVFSPFDVSHWPREIPEHWPAPERGGRFESRSVSGSEWRSQDPLISFWILESGWPLRALSWEFWTEFSQSPVGPGRPESLWRSGWPLSEWYKAIPLMPVWPGFVINTLLYAAAAAGTWTGMSWGYKVVWRWHCRRRDRCSACAYSRVGLAVDVPCPECGNDS